MSKSISINTKLYFLLTHAQGKTHQKEVEMGEKMVWQEAINSSNFDQHIEILKSMDSKVILEECLQELKSFNRNDQVNCLAWMCLIANADGFMDKSEWQLIYNIYHKHLGLELNEVMNRQKELHKFISQYRNIPENKEIDVKKSESLKSSSHNDK